MEGPTNISSAIVSGLRQLGYTDSLLRQHYTFRDWFSETAVDRMALVAAFGQTPLSFDSALIGVANANGLRSLPLVSAFRALGAPILLEIDNDHVREWAVAPAENEHHLIQTHAAHKLPDLFVRRSQDWRPAELLRAKNIRRFRWERQLDLFEGLLPELESQIQSKLDPLLRETLSIVEESYVDSTGHRPDPKDLFKLVFWLLAAKVFHDRKLDNFHLLSSKDPDILIESVAKKYSKLKPQLLNRAARKEAARAIWSALDFRNLSVDVLSEIWSTTLVDKETRDTLGIHRTSRSIVRYIVERIPFPDLRDHSKIIFEPCCGSATFLVGAMNRLRQELTKLSDDERHAYFVRHLVGMEKDPFGLEISNLVLTLADFPNPDGWEVDSSDVFSEGAMEYFLQRAGVVLSNPPFEEFNTGERRTYRYSSVLKPAELISRILSHLHPHGVLGMVLPRTFVDGNSYAPTRKLIADRYGQIELTVLPDRAFEADAEIALLIASDPIPHERCQVATRRVADTPHDWVKFERNHRVTSESRALLEPRQAIDRLVVPELQDIWHHLEIYPVLADYSTRINRGIRWNRPMRTKDGKETGMRGLFVKDQELDGYIRGVAPRTTFSIFEVPLMKWLSVRLEDRSTKASELPWSEPKVILNKFARRRGPWRIGSFPDIEGVSCYQTYLAVWPKGYDEVVTSAILNGPVANAYVATREGKIDVTIETLKSLPMPILSHASCQTVSALVATYQKVIGRKSDRTTSDAEEILKQIDALILDGYDLAPRLERHLLDHFRSHKRPTPHRFGDYFPQDCEFYLSLSRFLSVDHSGISAESILKEAAL